MFQANENFPAPSIQILRQNQLDVESILETSPGISDPEVIRRAIEGHRIILTFDKDYGELIFRYANTNPPAVVFFREKGQSPTIAAQALLHLLEQSAIQLEHAFTVIEVNGIRQRLYHTGK